MEKHINMKKKQIILILTLSLLTSGAIANVNSPLENGQTNVMNLLQNWQSGESLKELNELIVDDNFNPFTKDFSGSTALDYAIKYKVKPIEYFLQKIVNEKRYAEALKVTDISLMGESNVNKSLIKAIAGGHLTAVNNFLISHKNYDLNFELKAGITPLAATSLILDVDLAARMFTLLVANGADLNQSLTQTGGDSIGHVFCATDNYLMLLLAVSEGYSVNIENSQGDDVYSYSLKNKKSLCSEHLGNIIKSINEKIR